MGWVLILSPGNKFLHPALKDASCQQDAMLALAAFYAYIGTEPHHLPFIAAAGVRFLKPNYIA